MRHPTRVSIGLICNTTRARKGSLISLHFKVNKMVKTISIYDFRDAFKAAGRGAQFSYDGLEVIFDCIESYEQDAGEQVELDVIALCCEWAEDTVENIIRNYSIDCDDVEDDEIQNYVLSEASQYFVGGQIGSNGMEGSDGYTTYTMDFLDAVALDAVAICETIAESLSLATTDPSVVIIVQDNGTDVAIREIDSDCVEL